MTPLTILFATHAASPLPAPVFLTSDRAAPAPVTLLVAANGLFLRLETEALRATLFLTCWPDGSLRGLEAGQPTINAALAATALGVVGTPQATARHGLALAVARDPHHPLPARCGLLEAAGIQTAEPPLSLTYVVAANGVFAWGGTRHFVAWVPIAPLPVGLMPGLAPLTPGLQLRVSPLPAALLQTVLLEAYHVAQTRGHERLWHLCHDGARWSIVRPAQETAPGAVRDYDRQVPHSALVIHSHGHAGTFFSATDDADDQDLSLDAVIGNLAGGVHEARILTRGSVYGHRLVIPTAPLVAGLLPLHDGLEASHLDGDQPPVPAGDPGQAHEAACSLLAGLQRESPSLLGALVTRLWTRQERRSTHDRGR